MASNFLNDLPRGEQIEDLVVSLIGGRRGDYGLKYDIEGSAYGTVEVKGDYKSTETNNIAIEFRGNKKQVSGIKATQADTWCHVTKDCLLLYDVLALKEYLIAHQNSGEFIKLRGKEGSWNFIIPIAKAKTLPTVRIIERVAA